MVSWIPYFIFVGRNFECKKSELALFTQTVIPNSGTLTLFHSWDSDSDSKYKYSVEKVLEVTSDNCVTKHSKCVK